MPKFDFSFDRPLMNAAGSLGFAPPADVPLALGTLGAFITHPVSLGKRTPAHGPRCLPFPGGFLLHTGYPNPGLRAVIREFAPRWRRLDLPVLVHLLCNEPGEAAEMVRRLEHVEEVAGVELGLPPEIDARAAEQWVRAAAGEIALVVRLPLERAAFLAAALAPTLVEAGAVAVSIGPPRGALPIPQGGLRSGRLYGPAIFPLALEAVREVVQTGIPVIAAGGVHSQAHKTTMLQAGAVAVQLDTVLWRGGLPESL